MRGNNGGCGNLPHLRSYLVHRGNNINNNNKNNNNIFFVDRGNYDLTLCIGVTTSKMTGGTPEVRSDKSLTLLTFDI